MNYDYHGKVTPYTKYSDGIRWLFDQFYVTRHFEDYRDITVLYLKKNNNSSMVLPWYHVQKHGTSGTFSIESEVNACLRSADAQITGWHV